MQDIIVIYGPLIAAVVSGIFTIAAPFIGGRGSTRNQNILKWSVTLLAITALATGLSIFLSYWQPKDVWANWSNEIEKNISKCKKNSNQAAVCVKRALIESKDSIPKISDNKNTALTFYHDIRAGETLITIPEVQNIFYVYFGINHDTFIGSGSTVPWSHNPEYKNADAREYLVPNMPEDDELVWTWKFKRKEEANKEWKVRKIIEEISPTDSSNTFQLKNYLERLNRKRISVTSEPPVIRFQQFFEHEYKGTIGRPEAFRVFALSLQDVWDMSLEDAMRASGFTWDSKISGKGNNKLLYIWIYVPDHDEEVVPATWGNIIKNASKWLEDGNGTMSGFK